jgi:hypothetical protein
VIVPNNAVYSSSMWCMVLDRLDGVLPAQVAKADPGCKALLIEAPLDVVAQVLEHACIHLLHRAPPLAAALQLAILHTSHGTASYMALSWPCSCPL